MKRTKHPETWKVNVKKNARLRGEEYVGVGGKMEYSLCIVYENLFVIYLLCIYYSFIIEIH